MIPTPPDRLSSRMKDVSLSRRQCLQLSALAGCSVLLGGRIPAAEEPLQALASTLAAELTNHLLVCWAASVITFGDLQPTGLISPRLIPTAIASVRPIASNF